MVILAHLWLASPKNFYATFVEKQSQHYKLKIASVEKFVMIQRLPLTRNILKNQE